LAKITEADWRGYIRVKDETVQTSKLVLEALKTEEPAITPVPLNKLESTLLSYLKDQPRITLKQYMHLVNISQRRASRILLNLVLQGFIQMHDQEKEHYYTLS
jgi:predicted HTH transcriptional regulator